MLIGCTMFLEAEPNRILAIKCSKGRGIILPGGKWEEPESFHDTAMRECKEESGVDINWCKLIFGGFSVDGAYVYAFKGLPKEWGQVWTKYESKEGEKTIASWDQLFNSKFHAYYKVLKDAIGA
jgi:8-oxo-dGTP pyrophosphatase MutT (NUDIX family)